MVEADEQHTVYLREPSIEIQFLLSHLQRPPETRINKFLGKMAIERSSQDGTPQPPTRNLGYFLNRLGSIAQKLDNGMYVVRDVPEERDPQKSLGEIDKDPGLDLSDYAFLVWSRDFLAAITYPASVQTIKVTRAFREHPEIHFGKTVCRKLSRQRRGPVGSIEPINPPKLHFRSRRSTWRVRIATHALWRRRLLGAKQTFEQPVHRTFSCQNLEDPVANRPAPTAAYVISRDSSAILRGGQP